MIDWLTLYSYPYIFYNRIYRYENGIDISQLPLDSIADLDTVIIPYLHYDSNNSKPAITVDIIQQWLLSTSTANTTPPAIADKDNNNNDEENNSLPSSALAGKAILFHTNWSEHWNTPRYYSGEHPFLTKER